MSFPRYPKYKDSGVEWLGQVPEHWEVKRLKYNLRLLTEKTDRRENPVALENIEGWTGRFIPTETEFEGEGIAFEAGDILFGKLRPYLAKAYRAESSGEAVGDFHVMRPVAGIESRFAQYQILNRDFITIVDGSTFGSKMPRASWEFVGGMKLTKPTFAEQTDIAAFLDQETAKIDALVAEQKRLMVLLKEKRQAVISHAVTKGLNPHAPMKPSGIEWIGDVPKHWDVTKMKWIAKMESGHTPDKKVPEYWNGDIPWISLNDTGYLKDNDYISDDVLAAQMAARADDGGITFVAFTATPKNKTMELFGTRPDPSQPAGPGNLPAPFHVYSMQQAIEEKFILDVLKNYTPYKLAFKLAHEGKDYDEKTVERNAAMKGIMGWVRLHPYNIAQKVQVVVEHFREYVAPLLNGRGKAMVVVASRVEAVRWKLAIEKYITEHGYKIGALVAFSGEVNDKESGEDGFTENSKILNPNLRGRDIREAFKGEEYQILLVANKFQTGFDQPLLCGMYVDKRLAGIQAVQTLSRLNRAHPGKDTTYVLDFVNDPAEVLAAFKIYHTTAELSVTTDPNLVYNLRSKLDAAGHYDEFEVDRVVAVELKPDATQGELLKALEPVVDRLLKQYKAAQEAWKAAKDKQDEAAIKAAQDEMDALILFKSDMGAFIRLYTFLSQIFDYGNTALEKRSIFYKRLLHLLEFGREREGIDLSKVVLTHHNLKNLGKRTMPLSAGDSVKLEPITEAGSGSVQQKEKAFLNEIIQKVNDLFQGELTDQDKLVYVNNVIKGKLLESETLKQQAANNTKEQFANSPDLKNELMNAIIGALEAHNVMSTQALGSEAIRTGLKDVLLNHAGLYEELRSK